jgi:phage baseplate assembly protein W
MKTHRYRAWRFIHPQFDAPDGIAGLRVSNRGAIGVVEEHASVRQAILLLLSTRPGERVMRPNYGCNLHRLVFSPNDDTTAGLAMHYVRRAVERWEPRIEITHLDAGRDPNPNNPASLLIMLEYRIKATQRTDRIAYAFDLSGEQT